MGNVADVDALSRPRARQSRVRRFVSGAWQRYPGALVILGLLILWEIAGELQLFAFLPSIREIVDAGVTLLERPDVWRSWGRTLLEVFVGTAIAVGLGFVLGVSMAQSRVVEALFGLYVDLFQSAPVSAFVPVIGLVFGLGYSAIVATVTIFAFFVFTVNTYTGVKNVDPRLIEMARSFGAGRVAVQFRVVIPAARPMMLTGLGLAVGRGVNGGILGEMLISIVGIGGLLMYYGGAFQEDFVFALVFMVLIIAVVLMSLIQRLADKYEERMR